MCHRGSFREDIYKKCVLSKKDNNNKFKFIRKYCIFFIVLKIIQERKKKRKKDNKGIREIKKFIKELYIKFGEHNKKDE